MKIIFWGELVLCALWIGLFISAIVSNYDPELYTYCIIVAVLAIRCGASAAIEYQDIKRRR